MTCADVQGESHRAASGLPVWILVGHATTMLMKRKLHGGGHNREEPWSVARPDVVEAQRRRLVRASISATTHPSRWDGIGRNKLVISLSLNLPSLFPIPSYQTLDKISSTHYVPIPPSITHNPNAT